MGTIKDVARQARVAPSTVSSVLNGTKSVRPDTEARIRQAVHDLQYTPNHLARSLKTNRTRTIGVLTPNITTFFFTEIIEALEARLVEAGYSMVLCNFYNDKDKGDDRLRLLAERSIDGLVLLEGANLLDLSMPLRQSIPIVSIDARSNAAHHSILVDNYAGAYAAANLLCERGCVRTLMLTNDVKSEAFLDRILGYRSALRDNGRTYDEALVIECPISFEDGYRRMRAFLEEEISFDSLFAASYYLATGAMRALSEKGLRVPDDIPLVAFDDPPDAAFTLPAMTSVRQPMREMGEMAARLVVDPHAAEDRKIHVLPPTLIERDST